MTFIRPFMLSASILFLMPLYACSENDRTAQKPVFEKLPELADIKPERPVKIKLKRNVKGSYSWELSGSEAERIIETDMKLRNGLGK